MQILKKDTCCQNRPIRIVLTFILAGIAAFLFDGCNSQQTTRDIKIVAHRGGTVERPENTLPAYLRAVELGVNMIEIDLRISKDARLFILHDKTLDRTTNGKGNASNFTMEELKKLDAGLWFDSIYAGTRIPSFDEVLQWSKKEDIILLLDLKESGWDYAEMVVSEIHEFGNVEKIIIGVRSPDQANIFSELIPEAKKLAFMSTPDQIGDYIKVEVEVIRLWLNWLEEDPSLADQVRKTGAKLMINGKLGGIDETKKILSFFPDWILVDDPAQLIESLHDLNSKH